MGLDTTHDCWHGAYSAFMRWRQKLAEVAGFPPLMLMEGFFDPKEWWVYSGSQGQTKIDLIEAATKDMSKPGPWTSSSVSSALSALPIKWPEGDVLVELLYHSDCDGVLEPAIVGKLADRLEALLPKMPEGEGGGHIGNWRAKTQTFIDGLRLAASRGEAVEFH